MGEELIFSVYLEYFQMELTHGTPVILVNNLDFLV